MENFEEVKKHVIDVWNKAIEENKSTFDRCIEDLEFKKEFDKQYTEFLIEDEKMKNKMHIVPVEEDAEGNQCLQLPEEILASLNWKEGDTIVFTPQEDGTIVLTKK